MKMQSLKKPIMQLIPTMERLPSLKRKRLLFKEHYQSLILALRTNKIRHWEDLRFLGMIA
jgi:hypothetical protein